MESTYKIDIEKAAILEGKRINNTIGRIAELYGFTTDEENLFLDTLIEKIRVGN